MPAATTPRNWPVIIYVVAVGDDIGDQFFTSKEAALRHIVDAALEEDDAHVVSYRRER